MSLKPLTKRLLLLEAVIAIFFVYSQWVRSKATNFRTEAFLEKERGLRHLPDEIAGWKALEKKATAPRIEESIPGGLTILARSYHNDSTGQSVLLHLAYRYDPIPCYGRSGWKPVAVEQPLLTGTDAERLRRNNVHEARLERDSEQIAVLFWGDNLAQPRRPGSAAGSQKAHQIDWSSGALGDIQASLARLFRKGDITVKIVCADPLNTDQHRESLLRFTTETFNLLLERIQ